MSFWKEQVGAASIVNPPSPAQRANVCWIDAGPKSSRDRTDQHVPTFSEFHLWRLPNLILSEAFVHLRLLSTPFDQLTGLGFDDVVAHLLRLMRAE